LTRRSEQHPGNSPSPLIAASAESTTEATKVTPEEFPYILQVLVQIRCS
jgi:hypothetical protein